MTTDGRTRQETANTRQRKPRFVQMQPMTIPSKPKPQSQTSNPSGGPSTQVAPSPAASAVTPSQCASAGSPTNYASPQTPKSPKGRATTEGPFTAKQSGRRQSKANAKANTNVPSTPTAEQAGTHASSAPTPATMASTPDNKENNTLKRQREPEPSSCDHCRHGVIQQHAPQDEFTEYFDYSYLRMKRRLAVPRTRRPPLEQARTRTQRKMSERASQRGLHATGQFIPTASKEEKRPLCSP